MDELAWIGVAAAAMVALSLLGNVWMTLRYRWHLAEVEHRLALTEAAYLALERRTVEMDLRMASMHQAVQALEAWQPAPRRAAVDDRAARIEEMHRVLNRAQAASAHPAHQDDQPPMRWLDTEPAGLPGAYADTLPLELAVEDRKLPPLRKTRRL